MVPVSPTFHASTCLPLESVDLTNVLPRFCCFIRKDPNEEYHRISMPILYNFLEWALNLRRGKNGRRLPGIKCKSSLDTFWKVFRLVYERSTSNRIDKQMNRRMRRVCGPFLPLPKWRRLLSETDLVLIIGDSTIGQKVQIVDFRAR